MPRLLLTLPRLLLALVASALGGCAVYPAPGYGAYENYNAYGQPYVVGTSPAVISGSVIYEQRVGGGGDRGNGYSFGRGDRDGDGIANRFDHDRDGDGVRNSRDRYPNSRGWR